MNSRRSPLHKGLYILIFICLISGLVTSAAAADGTVTADLLCKSDAKTNAPTDSRFSPLSASCCLPKPVDSSASRTSEKPREFPSFACCLGKAISTQTGSKAAKPVEAVSCCSVPSKIIANVNGPSLPPPCPTPTPGPTCDLDLPLGSVVGDMPADTQAFWAPGKISPDVIVKAGTYWVIGEEDADNGDQYYEILLSCNYIFVPVASMQPSFQPPWNGEALPTTPAI